MNRVCTLEILPVEKPKLTEYVASEEYEMMSVVSLRDASTREFEERIEVDFEPAFFQAPVTPVPMLETRPPPVIVRAPNLFNV